MHRFAPVALATLLAATAPAFVCAQTPFTPPQATGRFTDPANLGGERVSPRTGRELPIDQGTLGLEELLRKLSTRASILNIVAHPDDEDGGMLTLYARGVGARVADLSLTRGEGGQNAMTGDFEDALGLLRTQELLANDRYTGVTQMFGTEVDFGFSKTKSESFAKWGHDRVLYDVVRAIRIYRPLVITATFVGAPTDGHGQHQVSGEIAQEAFVAAGDPKVFPELTKEGILPWQPLKMYARVPFAPVTAQGLYDYATGQYVPAEFTNYITGKTSSAPPTADITIHEGAEDPLITTCAANAGDLSPRLRSASSSDCEPLSYVQFARIGLGLQRTQIGPGARNARPGAFDVSYHLYGSKLKDQPAHEESFFDGIDTSLVGIASLAPDAKKAVPLVLKTSLAGIAQKIDSARKEIADRHTGYAASDLATALKLTAMTVENLSKLNPDLLPASEKENVLHELRIKRVQLNDALALALGLSIDATTAPSEAITRSAVPVHIVATTSTNDRIPYIDEELESFTGTLTRGPLSDSDPAITRSNPWTSDVSTTQQLTKNETRPYFVRDNIEQPVYKLNVPALRSAPAAPPALAAWVNLTFHGVDLKIGRVVHSGAQPVSIVPALNLAVAPHAQVLPNAATSSRFLTELHPSSNGAISPKITVPDGWKVSKVVTDVSADGFTFFQLNAPPPPRTQTLLSAAAELPDHQRYTEGFRPVGYGDLPRTNYYTPATDRIVPVDLKLPPENKRRIGYLEGTGDAVPAALASIGLTPTILKVSDLTAEKLKAFDAVILGVRTYNAHPDLHGAPTQALLEFARNGGNVVVQYQTYEFTAADAPYPLALGRAEKVVDETDPVKLLDPSSSLLSTPNRITPADFDGWIEERGHGFLDTWDPHYTALTETHDPGAPSEHVQPQAPQRGGLITVQMGKGRWTYCAFALYRQLPEAVPGAFRLFVNLLNR